MENTLDALSEKSLAQDLIRANQQAEAAEQERLRRQAEHYEQELSVLKDQADRNMEAIAGLHDKLDSANDKTHDTGVRIYRNVQAVILDEQKKQTEAITAEVARQFSMLYARMDALEKNAEADRLERTQEREQDRQATAALLKQTVKEEGAKEAEKEAGNDKSGTMSILMLVAMIAVLLLNVLMFMGISF
ncbi:MAG: hypothetical protein IK016_01225 [Lachnospiraceae bacterium]|nr:hypothetical protein [Lachnospiraceae bacterium]